MNKRCEDCLFKKISTQFLSQDEYELIRRTSVQLSFKKNEIIFKQGDKSSNIAFLYSGIVKFKYQITPDRDFVLTVVSGPKLLGGANLFFNETNLFSIEAVEDSEICLINNKALFKIISENNRYFMTILQASVDMYKYSIFNFINLSYKHVNGRIADILLYLSDQVYKSDNFKLCLTRKEISEFAACSPANVMTTINMLHKEGIIKVDSKKIEILDRKKLTEISKLG
ncbi:MAG TPA: Crp/Fnr family transcriptional regulator [Bacteroidales bacterium]|nr:Crp/Fnr family transcriptional regulator [Bacteroidales bacterium]HPS16984.1 Crp/Fnr family transcriptional regulator [Bacteroidales bacterium]